MIQIKRNNKVFFTLEDFGEGSKLSYQLMDHHYIILKFTTATPIYFEIGDSVEIPDFGYFELTSSYFPKHNDSDGYDYEMQMDAYYMSWKNKICKYRPQHGANETSFNLTTTVGVHMNVILGNLKALGLTYNGKDFSVDYTTYNNKAFDVQKRFLIEYGSISILDALNAICSEDALNCEWWIDGSIIYLGYCEMEGQTTFEQDVNVLSMSYSESKSTYITRLYAFGSDRNIPKGYFTGADADVTTDGVATDYLMLPNKEVDSDGFYAKDGYIENVNVVKNDKQAIEGVVMFEDEYPKVESAVSSIKTYDSTVDNEDGTKTTQTFWQVTATDSFATNFEASWIKSNLTLGIKFTSGALMGMEFDVSFKVIDKVNYFEIVANDTYGRTLPDGVMCPKVGDKFFLYNWDATKITDTDLIPTAQLSLFDRAKQYYQKTMISNANFTCTMDGDKFYNNGTYDYHPLGEQVKLINDMFAQVDADGKHYRNSRIIGMEIPLDIPYDHPQYTVGEKAATSRLGKLEDKVDSITVNGTQIGGIGSGNGSGGVYVIGMNDLTPPTDSNVLSARKSINSFLSKLTNDTAEGLITFAKGLIAKGLADLAMGATFGNSAKITELGEAFFRAIKSLDYDNAAEQGFSVEKEKNGKYHAFFTNLTIWGKARFHELEVRKLSYSGGNIYLSGAGSKLIKVVPVKKSVPATGVTTWVETTEDDAECVGWKCYLLADNGTTATMNDWQEGDQARCQTMGEIVSGGTYQNASNKSYWRTIPDGGVSTQNEKIYGTKTETYLDEDGNEQTKEVQVELYDGQAFAWIVIGKHCGDIDGYDDEFSVGYNGSNPAPLETRDIPSAGDTIVLDGNRHRNEQQEYDKTDRQNVIILETTGEYAPRIACYANISEYKHTITKRVNGSDKEVSLSVFETSPKGGTKINSSRFEWISDDGSTINIINYRGDWAENNTYHKNDQVNHNNAVWVCVANSGVDVSEEPLDGATYWKKVLSGGKGEKGDKGDDGLSGSGIVPAYTRSEDTPTLPTSKDKNNLDNGWSLAIPSVGDVENVSYGDSSWTDYNDGSYTWKKSPTTAASSTSSCLVTFTTTQANQVVKFVIKSLSEPRYDYIFLSEIDAASVPSRPTSNGGSRAVSGNGVELSVTDIIATAGTHTVYVCYGKDSSGSFHGDYGLFRIDSSAGIPLWQSNGKEVFTREDSGAIKSEIESWSEPFRVTGEDGTDGKDAVSYTVTLTRGSNGVTQGLYVGVTRYIGTACTTGTIISFGMSCKAYTDGTLAEGLTDRLQTSDNYIDFAAFPKAKSFTVELLDKNGNKVATGNYSSGDDAISILVEDAPLVFDTDDSGTVPADDTKTAKVKVMRGNANVTNDCNQESSRDDLSSNCMCEVKKDKDNECISVSVQGRWIVKNDVIVDGVNQGKVSTTSGYAVAQFVYDSVVYFAQVPFSVNVAKFTGVVAFNNKQYESKFTEISTKFGQDLADAESRITQTAREISLSVSEKSVGRRNMLIGSACRKYGDGFIYMDGGYHDGYPLEQIEKNSGIDGVNCIHCRTKQTRTGSYYLSGFRWHGLSPQGNIKLQKGKNYVLSFYAKTHTPNDIVFMAEVLYQGSKIDTSRPAGYDGPTGYSTTFAASEADKWELFTVKVSVPSNAKYEYVEINIFARARNYSFVSGYICKPMLEEGENYNGWTLSEQDYDYVGGNLLDNARTLDKSGTLFAINDTVIQNGYGTDSACIKNLIKANATLSDYKEVLRWVFGSTYLVNGNDYIFSFVAKADVDDARVVCYMWSGDIENSCDIFTEGNSGTWDSRSDGNVVFILSRQWTRYWVHWRPKNGYATPKEVIIRHTGNNSTSASTVYVTQPKLEIGATMTEWTERKSDLVDKASLKKAGIEITSEKVKLYGDQIEVKPKKDGNDVYALFGSDGFINTNILNVQHVYAKNTNGAVYGHFGYLGAEGGTDSAGNQYPLWVGASNCGYAPFSVRSDGYMVTTSGRIGAWSLTERNLTTGAVVDSNYGTYMGTCLSMNEMDTAYNANNCKFLVAMGKGAFYYDPFSPLKSGFYEDAKFRGNASERSDRFHVNSNNEHTYLSNSFYSSMYIKKEIGENSSSSRVDVSQPALLVDSDGVGITSPGGNFFGGLAIGVLEAQTTTDGQDASNSIREQLDDNRGSFVTINNAPGKTTKFYLPKYPQEGQMLIVLQINSGTIQFYASNSKLMAFKNTLYRSGEYWTSTTQGQFSVFVYANGAWRIQLMNGR